MSKYQIRYSNDSPVGLGNLLGDVSAKGYEYYNATLDEKINCAGTLTFTLLPDNPALPNVALRSTTIMLYRNDAEIWRGRIIRTEIDMFNRRVITCEGVLAWLYDVLSKGLPHYMPVSPGQNINSPSYMLGDFITYYRSKCSDNRMIWVGTVEPTQDWYPADEAEYITIFDLLAQLRANSGGYYKVGFRSDGDVQIDYLNYPTTASGQPITFGHNLFDLARVIDASNVVTTLYAEDSAGHTTTITNAAMETAFGKSQAYRYFDDCESATELFSLAMSWFNNNCLSNTTISVSALDLNLTDEAFDAFYVGQPIHIVSDPHGVDTMMFLTGLQTNISNPEVSRITLGTAPRGLTSYVKGSSSSGFVGGAGAVTDDKQDSVSTITPTITQTTGSSTLSVTAARKFGNVVQLGLHFTVTGNITEGDNVYTGTLSNYLPVAYISTASYYGVATPSGGVVRITANGDINFRLVKGSLTTGNDLYCGLTYITKE